MIQFSAHMRILVSTQPLDMRKGIDGVASQCRQLLQENPMSGALFLFISRSRKHIKILTYDGQGYWLATKRLSTGRFPYWPKTNDNGKFLKELEACQAQVLLHGGDPSRVTVLGAWRKIS